jgi:hypothetical protein
MRHMDAVVDEEEDPILIDEAEIERASDDELDDEVA